MMTKTKIISIVNILLIVDIGIVLFCYLQREPLWFINSQVGFFSSVLVVAASFYSYSQMVQNGVSNEIITSSGDDVLEKIEDPHGLYEEEQEEQKISTVEAVKKNRAYVSFFRIIAYALLVAGFLYLEKSKVFDVKSYFVGLTIPPILIVMILFISFKKESKNETC